MSMAPFGECPESLERLSVRTERYTYVRTLGGPWLLCDNQDDPYQMHNLIDEPDYADSCEEIEQELQMWLQRTADEFLPAQVYRDCWNLVVDECNAIPYHERITGG